MSEEVTIMWWNLKVIKMGTVCHCVYILHFTYCIVVDIFESLTFFSDL